MSCMGRAETIEETTEVVTKQDDIEIAVRILEVGDSCEQG
ncbi:hypothetical protein BCJMU51_2456 [Bacillus cereus]|nr:hypothetical protein BCM0045_2464 [Bacillus cereus]BCC00392.1 hypothetical protein BCM0057_2474 [Bacillus cereus]BCC23897.1 hypothetical protein BCM0079_2490 [Bacillus cereus]BCC35494.1 hypothetical protein BCM0105_2484 [Bacillus cereus]BCC41266.1 hypothetical protein BCJMU01_2433 [Bacillus cereus]